MITYPQLASLGLCYLRKRYKLSGVLTPVSSAKTFVENNIPLSIPNHIRWWDVRWERPVLNWPLVRRSPVIGSPRSPQRCNDGFAGYIIKMWGYPLEVGHQANSQLVTDLCQITLVPRIGAMWRSVVHKYKHLHSDQTHPDIFLPNVHAIISRL